MAAALDLAWPPLCPACRGRALHPRDHFCEGCWKSLRPVAHGDGEEAEGERVLAAFACDAVFMQMLTTSKYRRCRQVGRRLCEEAAAAIARRVLPGALVPVPLTRTKRRERGFNQTEDFAIALAARTGCPVQTGWLRRVRGGRALAGLEREARRSAVGHAFVVDSQYPGEAAGPVWLVEDVVTTGSTVAACGAALRSCGGSVLGVLAMGRAFAATSDRPVADHNELARL